MNKQNESYDPLKYFFERTNTLPLNYPYQNIYIGNIIMNSFNNTLQPPPTMEFFNRPDKSSPDGDRALSDKPHNDSDNDNNDTNDNSAPLGSASEASSEAIPSNPQPQLIQDSQDQKTPPVRLISQPYIRNIWIQPEIMLTHSMVIIRVNLSEGMDEKDLKITINEDHAVIKWASGYMEQLVPLPADIISNSASAVVKDRVLEIHILRSNEGDIREVNIK